MVRFGVVAVFLAMLAPAEVRAGPTGHPARDFTSLVRSDLLDFRYSFPTAVGSYSALLAKIREDEASTFKKALEGAKADEKIRSDDRPFPFHRHEFWRDWTISGQTERLIALRSHTEWFTGGAHPNRNSGLMLWDKEKRTALTFEELFISSTGYWPVMKDGYCRDLIAERVRRGFEPIADCTTPKDLVLVPVDTNSDWEFDRIHVVADPYVAGAYVEGTYEIVIPVNAALASRVKPEYRSSFEVHPQ
jgi:hypothetical protein